MHVVGWWRGRGWGVGRQIWVGVGGWGRCLGHTPIHPLVRVGHLRLTVEVAIVPVDRSVGAG